MRATIDGQPYSVGLYWGPVESAEEIAERRDETGRERGVILRQGQRIVGVGLAEDDGGRRPPLSAAALLALHYSGLVLAIEWAEDEAGRRVYWLAATLHGLVVHGTDILIDGDDPGAVHRQIEDLRDDGEFRLLGTASAAFGGTGGALGRRPSGRSREALAPRRSSCWPCC
jgi:hypothetical protein